MPTWTEVQSEVSRIQFDGFQAYDLVRLKYVADLHQHTGRNVIAYYSGFLSKPDAQADINDKNGVTATQLCRPQSLRERRLKTRLNATPIASRESANNTHFVLLAGDHVSPKDRWRVQPGADPIEKHVVRCSHSGGSLTGDQAQHDIWP